VIIDINKLKNDFNNDQAMLSYGGIIAYIQIYLENNYPEYGLERIDMKSPDPHEFFGFDFILLEIHVKERLTQDVVSKFEIILIIDQETGEKTMLKVYGIKEE